MRHEHPPIGDTLSGRNSERCRAERVANVLLIGKLHDGAGESACLVLNISTSGAMVRLNVPAVVGQAIEIELRGIKRARATVRWVKEKRAGLQFDQPQQLEPVFCLVDEHGLVARAPRFDVSIEVVFRLAAGKFPARIVNISPGGVRLETDARVEPGQTGQIMLPDRQTGLFGSVRWVAGSALGVHFPTPLPMTVLQDCLAG